MIHCVTSCLLPPGMTAQRSVDETLDVSLLHLEVCLHLNMFGDILPVTEAEHLHSVQEPCVLSSPQQVWRYPSSYRSRTSPQRPGALCSVFTSTGLAISFQLPKPNISTASRSLVFCLHLN